MTSVTQIASLLKLTQHEPINLDGVLAEHEPRRNPVGKDIAPCSETSALPPCPFVRSDAVVVAMRVAYPLEDATDVAFRLAALAVEQDIEVVVFSDLDYSGLERFGFRTERIAGATVAERDACVQQLRMFWGAELLI